MANCTGSSADITQDLHIQHTVLAVVQTQYRTNTHNNTIEFNAGLT